MQSQRRCWAETAKFIDNHGNGRITPAGRRRRQFQAEAEILRHDTDDNNVAWCLTNETQRGEQIGETQLMRREARLEQHFDVIVFKPDQAARRPICIYRIGHDQAIAVRDHVEQVHPRGAAVEHLDVAGQLVGRSSSP